MGTFCRDDLWRGNEKCGRFGTVGNKSVVILQRWKNFSCLGWFLGENVVDKFMQCKIPVVQIWKCIFNLGTGATCKGQFLDLWLKEFEKVLRCVWYQSKALETVKHVVQVQQQKVYSLLSRLQRSHTKLNIWNIRLKYCGTGNWTIVTPRVGSRWKYMMCDSTLIFWHLIK